MNRNRTAAARRMATPAQRSFVARMALSVLVASAITIGGVLLLWLAFVAWITTVLQGAHF